MGPETERETSDQDGLAPDEGVVGLGDQTTTGKQTGAAGAPRPGGPAIGPTTGAKGSLQDAIPSPNLGHTPDAEDDGSGSNWRNGPTPAEQDDGSGSDWRNGPTPVEQDDGSGSDWREGAGSVG